MISKHLDKTFRYQKRKITSTHFKRKIKIIGT